MPLIVFSAAFAGVLGYLEFGNVVMFSRPGAFALLLAIPWSWWMHVTGFHGLAGLRSAMAQFIRFTVIAVFAMLLAEPRAVRESRTLSVVYALDLSDSIGEGAVDDALEYVVKTATERPEGDEAGLIFFGRDAAVELPPGPTFPFEAINCRIARDGTSLEKGLSLAAAMVPEENQGRIVFISDGTETEGSHGRVLDELKSRQVPVDVLPVQYDYEYEVWLEKLEMPKFVKVGETYEATIVLSSLKSGAGTLVLQENGNTIARETVAFEAGKNRYVLPLYMRGPGYYEYVATIEVPPDQDGWVENNTAISYLYLKGEGRVLVVVDPAGNAKDYEPLVNALREAERLVDVQTSYEFSRDPLSLMPYDCIIFVNVAADAFDIVQLNALKDAVHSQGVGFLMIGGQNSYGPGGYHRSPIEEALPVSMDISQKKVLPKGALAIILHTCEFPEGNTWGKRIAKEAVRVLSSQDEVGVLAYTYQGGEKWLFPLTPAGEYESLVKIINQAEIGDMPSFASTMKMGLDGLKASDAATKHMIIISDGDPSPPPPPLVNEFVQNKVSMSMVAVFPHGGQDISIMRSIASTTGGRYYFPQDPALLPSIFIKEAKTLRRSMIQNKTFVPQVEMPSPVLKGVETMPELKGYVLTTPKPRATVILKGPEPEEIDPVLAVWRYGLGKTAAFTSDLSANWASSWLEWGSFIAFVKQLVSDVSRVETKSFLHVSAFASGNTGVITVEDHRPEESFLDVVAAVTGPRGKSLTVPLKQTGTRRYEGQFPLWGKGRYHVMVSGKGGVRDERALGGFVVPYSPEYLRFRSNPIVLRQVAERTGGRMLSGDETGADIFPSERDPRSSSRPMFDWFIIMLACLIPLDVGVRRVQLDLTVIKGWLGLGRRKGASTETLGALLQRKKNIEFVRDEEQTRRVPSRSRVEQTRPARTTAPVPKPVLQSTPKPVEKPDEPQSTAGRLLARKRKWQEKEDE